MKLPEEVKKICQKRVVMRSPTSGRVHNGERFSRSYEEAKQFMENAIVDTNTGTLYRPSIASMYVKGDGSTYFDIYFLTGLSVFTAYKVYSPGCAHLTLGMRRPGCLLRMSKIRKGSSAEKMYYDTEEIIGVRVFKDRTYVPMYLDKDENLLTRVKPKKGDNLQYVKIEEIMKDRARRSDDRGNFPQFVSEAPDIEKGLLYPAGRGYSNVLSQHSAKIVQDIFPKSDPYVIEFARKHGSCNGTGIKIEANGTLFQFMRTAMRLKSKQAEETLNSIRAMAADEFEKARYIRRRLSSQFVLLSKKDDWLFALERQYAINKYNTYAVNMKNGKHYALNTDGASMPFVISRLSGNRVIINGTIDEFDGTQLGKIIKCNPPQLDRKDAEVAGVILTSISPCILNGINKSGGNYIEQALSLEMKNIAGCLLNHSITTMPQSALTGQRAEMHKRFSEGGWYNRTEAFGQAVITLLAGKSSLVKAFEWPIAKIRKFDELIGKNIKKDDDEARCNIRMNDIISLFDKINIGALDDESFENVVATAAKCGSSRHGGGDLGDVWREIPDEQKNKGDIAFLRKLAQYGNDFGTYRDYLRLRREVGNLPGSQLDEAAFELFPEKDRIQALHDRLIRKKTEFENMGRAERLKVMNKAYSEGPYKKAKRVNWEGEENDKYIIVAVEKIEDLDVESNTLHHCVSSYKDSVMHGVEYIVFLRKKAEPTIPFITMDIDPSWSVRQIHGKYNSNVDSMEDGKDIMDFLNRWADAKQFIKKDSLKGHYGALCHM